MAKETVENALRHFDERYFKLRLKSEIVEDFGKNLFLYLKKINQAVSNGESEEHIKNIINEYLKVNFYQDDRFTINAYKKADSVISYENKIYAVIEVKKPSNKNEMPSQKNINKKALWEIVYYYLCETRDVSHVKVMPMVGSEIRRLIITDSKYWFLINANDLDKICSGFLEKHYYKYANSQLPYSNDIDKFYQEIQQYFNEIDITEKLKFLYFEIDEMYVKKSNWKYLYKIFNKSYLIKDGYKQIIKTHVLNNRFYQELLYLMGFEETKKDNKTIILIDRSIKNSLADQVYNILTEYKEYPEEIATDKTFELVVIWINRLLFIKLFEGQLISFNGDKKKYRILDNEKISSFEDIQNLFFEILGKKERKESSFISMFADIPYLNSSLFEKYEIEKTDINICQLKNAIVKRKNRSILGKNGKSNIPIIEYLIDFFNSYSFRAQVTTEDTVVTKSEIIDASVLGLIFEKINGHKDGSFYTKSFVTEYICKETINKIVIQKINNANPTWMCKSFDDIKIKINGSLLKAREINEIINTIRICDPAVGSGHFLVSALNCIIALKKELGVLLKYDKDERLTEYDIVVIDDVLCVFDGQGNEFSYNPNNALSQSIQKTLFNEKRQIIENCIFGVDINAKAVAICQLRLWIELLKNAYYDHGVMETLPNIDIDIKCGNSLISKLNYSIDKKINEKSPGIENKTQKLIKQYKETVKKYKATSDKKEKDEVKKLISNIKNTLYSTYDQIIMNFKSSSTTFVSSVDIDKEKLFANSLEWAIEFPEILGDDGTFLGFDCIIGNPPYIRVQELEYGVVDYYKTKWQTACQRIDISTLFIELAYSLISQNGFISYITSNQFLTTEYGRSIRQFLKNKEAIDRIVDFADLPVFDGALTYVSIFSLTKNRKKSFKYYLVPSLPFIEPMEQQFNLLEIENMDNDNGWSLGNIIQIKLLKKIKESSIDTLSTYAKCWAGAFTGKDDILMFDINQKIEFIEEDLLMNVTRAQGCERYNYAKPTKKIFYPYTEINGKTELISEEVLKEKYPKAYIYVMKYMDDLKRRKDSRKTFADKKGWYGLVRYGKLSRFKRVKIVSPGEVKKNKFSLDISESAFSCGRVFSITVENKMIDIKYLLAILNSKVIEFYLHNVSSLKQGGYYSYSSKAIDSIPLIFQGINQKEFIEIVDEILLLKEEGKQTDELEKVIDDKVYSLYGISQEEINYIEKFLE